MGSVSDSPRLSSAASSRRRCLTGSCPTTVSRPHLGAMNSSRPWHCRSIRSFFNARILLKGRLAGVVCVRKEVCGIKLVVAKVLVRAPVKLIGTRSGRDVDDSPRVAAEFGVVAVGLHAEL